VFSKVKNADAIDMLFKDQLLEVLNLLTEKDFIKTDPVSFENLFKKINTSISFLPYTNSQNDIHVTGILETRNMDYENLFILDMVEGAFPASAKKSSFIPFALRKVSGLPTHDHENYINSYHFYQLISRSTSCSFFVSSPGKEVEPSR
jgi:inactivated superfamily I helicase